MIILILCNITRTIIEEKSVKLLKINQTQKQNTVFIWFFCENNIIFIINL